MDGLLPHRQTRSICAVIEQYDANKSLKLWSNSPGHARPTEETENCGSSGIVPATESNACRDKRKHGVNIRPSRAGFLLCSVLIAALGVQRKIPHHVRKKHGNIEWKVMFVLLGLHQRICVIVAVTWLRLMLRVIIYTACLCVRVYFNLHHLCLF